MMKIINCGGSTIYDAIRLAQEESTVVKAEIAKFYSEMLNRKRARYQKRDEAPDPADNAAYREIMLSYLKTFSTKEELKNYGRMETEGLTEVFDAVVEQNQNSNICE